VFKNLRAVKVSDIYQSLVFPRVLQGSNRVHFWLTGPSLPAAALAFIGNPVCGGEPV
jgi:hypothetical protein